MLLSRSAPSGASGRRGTAETKGDRFDQQSFSRTPAVLAVLTAGLLAGLMLPGSLGAVAAQGPPPLHNYRIDGVSTKEQRTAIARTGASIEAIAGPTTS